MELKMTQSLFKSLADYKMKLNCGLQVKAQYVDGVEFPPTAAQLLGQWFEWKATGQFPRNGKEPIPPRLKPKKLTKKEIESGLKQEDVMGEFPKAYRDIEPQIKAVKDMLDYYDYEIISTGKRLSCDKLNLQGDIDLEVKKRGEDKIRFIDIKSSGLLEDKWSDYGWADEALEYKDRLMVQAVHYKILGNINYGYYPDFYFWVFSTKNAMERKNIKVEVDTDRYNQHLSYLRKAQEYFNEQETNGWIARPTPKRCGKCPLKENCSAFVTIPKEQIVYY